MSKYRHTVEIWGKDITLRTSGLAPKVYRDEFGSSLTGDYTNVARSFFGEAEKMKKYDGFDNVEENAEKIIEEFGEDLDRVEEVVYGILQIAYALNKTDNFGDRDFPTYEEWLDDFETMDLAEVIWLPEVITVITDGYFRKGKRRGSGKTSEEQ